MVEVIITYKTKDGELSIKFENLDQKNRMQLLNAMNSYLCNLNLKIVPDKEQIPPIIESEAM